MTTTLRYATGVLLTCLVVASGCSGSADQQRREATSAVNTALGLAHKLLQQHKQVDLVGQRVALFTVEPDIGSWYSLRRMHVAPIHRALREALAAAPYDSDVVVVRREITPTEMLGGVDAAMGEVGADRAVFLRITQSGNAVEVDIGMRGATPEVVIGRFPIDPSKLTYLNPIALLIFLSTPLVMLGLAAFRLWRARGVIKVELRQHPRASQSALVLAVSNQPINANVGDATMFRRQFRQLTSSGGVTRLPLGDAPWPPLQLRPGTWFVQVYGVIAIDGVDVMLDESLQQVVTLQGGATATISFDLAPGVVLLHLRLDGTKVDGIPVWLGRERDRAAITNASGKATLCAPAGNHELSIESDGVVVRRGVVMISGRDQELAINIDRERTLARSTLLGASSRPLASAGLGPVEARIMAPTAARHVDLPQPGDVLFERFEIAKLLGHGLGGPVYAATDERSQKEVVLRVLPRSARNDPYAYGAYVESIEVLAQLRHPNVARVYQVASEGERVFVISAKIDGTPLQSFLDKRGALPVPQALEIARQLANGLVALHAQNLFHRNLSPHDIFVTHKQEVLIADVGLQQLMEVVSHGSVAVRGNVEYLSPELLGGGHSFEARSDLYSLGCVVYAMLAGRPPFPAISAARDHVYAPASRLAEFVPALPPKIDEFVAACLAKSPAERPKSAQQVAQFLERTVAAL